MHYANTPVVGAINSTRLQRTWWNVDIKQVVGENAWREHERFNIRLNAITVTNSGGSFGATAEDRLFNIQLEGLPFENSTYNQVARMNTATCVIGSVILIASTSSQGFTFDTAFQATFSRCENTSIRITFVRPDGAAINLNGNLFPRTVFFFSIFPVQ